MSLRTRLLILVIAAMLVPAILVGLRFVQNRASEIDAALANLAASADDIASDLGEKIQGTAQLHYGLARARDLDTRDKAACSAFLSDVREEYPQFTGILTIDPDGSLFCDSLRTDRTLDLNDRGYFKQVKGLHGVVAVEPVFGRLTGLSVLQIAYPVRSEAGALKFVLLASFNLNKFAEFHDKRLLAEKDILLIDAKGTVLVAPTGGGWSEPVGGSIAASDLFRFAAAPDREPFREVSDREGRTQIWAVARSPSIRKAGLYILVGRSKDGLLAAANRRLLEDTAILAVASLLLLAGVWILTTVSVGRQVGRLAAMARSLGRGDLSARIPEPHPGGELGGLMTLLNSTAESLEQQRAAIADLSHKLSQSQKMEAMGQLTGGVAHDFNNLLTVILGNSEHLAGRLAANKELQRIADDIATAAERGSDLTRSLLAFARKQPLRPREIDIAEQVTGMKQLLRRTLGEHIDCSFTFGPDLWLASVDPSQLATAVLNLVLNARDAMPDGGKLMVEVRNISLGESDLDVNGEPRPGDYVMLAVQDTGTGMSGEVLGRAFEPFFTTKEVGKGTGLGLSMVYGFAQQSGGLVQMQSEPGQGSVVRLFFPRLATPPSEEPLPAERGTAHDGHETILVVEDDQLVRDYVLAQLHSLGYVTLQAANAAEALAIVAAGERFDLLFTDVIMPGKMNGRQLADELQKTRPDLKVVYTSGYTENAIIHHGRLDSGVLLLAKPYRKSDLARIIRKALSN